LLRKIGRKFIIGPLLNFSDLLLSLGPPLWILHHLLVHPDQVPLAVAVRVVRPWLHAKLFLASGAHAIDLSCLQEDRDKLLSIIHSFVNTGAPCQICTDDFPILQIGALDYSANGAL
jgi:hypothetical protein